MPSYFATLTDGFVTGIRCRPDAFNDTYLDGDILVVWEISDDGLTVTKYEEPERLFAYGYRAGGLSTPRASRNFGFPSAPWVWYELIDGNYIRLTDEQVTALREAALS